MRRWLLESGRLRVDTTPDPVPAPGEVLVRLRAWSLNYRDLMILRGEYGAQKLTPLVPLSDGAGEVVALGTGAASFTVGDRVVGCFFQRWAQGPFTASVYGSDVGFGVQGVLCELRAFPAEALARVPEHLDFAQAATLPCAGVTAWNALRGLQSGQTMLTLGTGGVSLFAIQLAKAIGARVIVTSSSDEKLARARQIGADAGVNYTMYPKWSDEVVKLAQAIKRPRGTGPISATATGVDLVVETAGAKTFEQSLAALTPGGTLALVGRLTGATQGVNLQPAVGKWGTIRGIYVGSRAELQELGAFMQRHKLQPTIDSRFAFEDAPRAFEALAAGPFGKVVIDTPAAP